MSRPTALHYEYFHGDLLSDILSREILSFSTGLSGYNDEIKLELIQLVIIGSVVRYQR